MGDSESTIYTGKYLEKELNLVYEEGDDVISGLKRAVKEHNIREASALKAEGLLKEATITYFNHNRFVTTDLKNGRIISCSGRFMNLKDGVYGDLHVGFMLGMQLWDGTLVRALAKDGFSLTLQFKQPVNQPFAQPGLESIQY